LPAVSFEFADLRGASFRAAQVFGSFDSADLRRARFDRAFIGGHRGKQMSFFSACLSGASFARANIYGADFRWTEGRGVDVRGARIEHTSFAHAMLIDVRGRPEGWGVRRGNVATASRHLCADTLALR